MFEVARGRAAVLARLPELQALAARCGQVGVFEHLPYFFSVPYFGAKTPELLLARDREGSATGAALFYEYRVLGLRTGIYIPADADGERTIVALALQRAELAAAAAQFLIDRGASLVLSSFSGGSRRENLPPSAKTVLQVRSVQRDLLLASSMEATLDLLGRHTRRNLRHFQRRAETELGARLVTDPDMREEEFVELNRNAAYRVPDKVARYRYRSLQNLPRGYFAALRATDGRWLSVVGGRRFDSRQGAGLALDWQVNALEFPSFSLGMTMLSFLLEDAVRMNTKVLRFEGGTSHSIHKSLQTVDIHDLLTLGKYLTPNRLRNGILPVLPGGNLLKQILFRPDAATSPTGPVVNEEPSISSENTSS